MVKHKMNFTQKLKLICKLLSSLDGTTQMQKILEDLMTPQEIETIAERILLMQALQSGKSQRQVAEDLHISVTTVNRGARILKYGSGEINKVL